MTPLPTIIANAVGDRHYSHGTGCYEAADKWCVRTLLSLRAHDFLLRASGATYEPIPVGEILRIRGTCLAQHEFVTSLHKLYARLCRELAQSEHSAVVHTRREARRLGDVPPAKALLSLGQHAEMLRPRFTALLSKRQPAGMFAGRTVGQVFSTLRHFLFDRLIDTERSYRGTLLGFHHGIACARLLREVADRVGDDHMVSFCDDMLADRVPLLEAAEQQVAYFARRPQKAIKSGLSVAFEPLTEQ